MRIFEFNQPTQLYHGTSSYGWEEISHTGVMIDHGNGICFSRSYDVAEDFARMACSRDECEMGKVIAFDYAKLAAAFPLIDFKDELDSEWAIQDEQEVRIHGLEEITDVKRFIVSAHDMWRDSEWNHGELKGFGY